MIDVIWGSTDKPIASSQLADALQTLGISGTLYIGYPIIASPEGPFPFDALLLSPEKSAVVFNIVEGKTLENYRDLQDESYNKLMSKLLQHKQLVRARELQVKISVITFAPAVREVLDASSVDYHVSNLESLPEDLAGITWNANELYPALVAVIQSITTIRKSKKKRQPIKPTSRGTKLKRLEDSIANLDNMQGAAVIETFEGVQRIRGLAGSGKTIVLALKVAYLHAQHPEWQIAITFNTRSLKGQLERFITSFALEQTGDEPDWERIQVIHAWGAAGGKNSEGMYYKFCKDNGIEYLDYKEAKAAFGFGREFDGACEKALQEVKSAKQIYDAILVDEAQDFSPHFLVLCYEMLKEPKRLIYAYDELQSLTSKTLPPPEEIFGKNVDGTPRVRFLAPIANKPKQDIILEKCYRNSRPILTTAHALGFGIYRKDGGLIQMFDQKELWREIGYTVDGGTLEEGQRVRLKRTAESSPLFLEEHSPVEDLIQFVTFSDDEKQTDWLVNSIVENLRNDELDPDDIVVINTDPVKTRDAVGVAREKLLELGINSSLAGVSSSPDVFFQPDSVTFTGVFRAKGNEAAMVYVINAQDCYSAWRGDIARVRNRLFTAITRSKAWVRVCGYGRGMNSLAIEFEKLKHEDFILDFQYPTEQERRELNIVNRDMTEAEKQTIHKKKLDLKGVLESLESGETILDDYPDEIIEGLRKFLGRKTK